MTPLPHPIVFITGTFISNACWERWMLHFQNKGYTCIAPAWPFKTGSAQELRNRLPDEPLAKHTIRSLTNYFAGQIAQLSEKPILIGHSLGGLIVQLLLEQDLAVAGVAIHPFPPRNINIPGRSYFRMLWTSVLFLSFSQRTCLISFSNWKRIIANGLTYHQQKELYYKYAVPESRRIIIEAFTRITKLHFKQLHTPLLITSGGNDKLIPGKLNFLTWQRYAQYHSRVSYQNFDNHLHLVFDCSAREAEADHILQWLHMVIPQKA